MFPATRFRSRDERAAKRYTPRGRACAGASRRRRGVSVLLDVLLALDVGRLGADLLVVLLEGGEILTGLAELTLLHTLTDVPVDEGALRVHEVELVVDAGEHLGDGGRVGDHADGALHLGEVTTRDDGRRLVVDGL